MPHAIVNFKKIIFNSQELGTSSQHMVSKVFFDLSIDGVNYVDLTASVGQTPGSDFEKYPLTVTAPVGYEGPFNADAFRAAAENYYRSQIGAHGKMFNLSGKFEIVMTDVSFTVPFRTEFDIP